MIPKPKQDDALVFVGYHYRSALYNDELSQKVYDFEIVEIYSHPSLKKGQ